VNPVGKLDDVVVGTHVNESAQVGSAQFWLAHGGPPLVLDVAVVPPVVVLVVVLVVAAVPPLPMVPVVVPVVPVVAVVPPPLPDRSNVYPPGKKHAIGATIATPRQTTHAAPKRSPREESAPIRTSRPR
jgi:hypothetical protein